MIDCPKTLLRGQPFPFVGLGRRRLIPSLEQETFSVPVVTPTKEAISSQLTPDLMSSLICSIRSGVSFVRRPRKLVAGDAASWLIFLPLAGGFVESFSCRESWWASFRGAIRAAWGDGPEQGREGDH